MKSKQNLPPSLESPQIPDRAEAVRQLGLKGGADDLERLLQVALEDRSSGIRLAAAAAAADILSRSRLPEVYARVPVEQRQALLARLRSLDPGVNTSLFQVLAELGLPEVPGALTLGLRDPRVDVRTGALVGMERLFRSPACNLDPAARASLGIPLADPRLRPEVALELARLAVRMGFFEYRSAIEALQERLPPKWFNPFQEVLDELADLELPERIFSLWIGTGEGRDIGSSRDWRLLRPAGWYGGIEPIVAWTSCEVGGGRTLTTPDLGAQPMRRMRLRLERGEREEVLQVGTLAFREAGEKEVLRFIGFLVDGEVDLGAGAEEVVATLIPHLGTRPQGILGRALLCGWTGDVAQARVLLEGLVGVARAPAEAHWYLSRILQVAGDPAAARDHLRAYVEKAAKKAPFLAEARQLLGDVPGRAEEEEA